MSAPRNPGSAVSDGHINWPPPPPPPSFATVAVPRPPLSADLQATCSPRCHTSSVRWWARACLGEGRRRQQLGVVVCVWGGGGGGAVLLSGPPPPTAPPCPRPCRLPYSVAWLGWIAGPACLIVFFSISMWSSHLLAQLYCINGVEFARYHHAVRYIRVGGRRGGG